MWLEMSRDEDHGGSAWGFGECLWSPTRKESGARWPYWELLGRIKAGEVVLHLRGRNPKKVAFVGYSIASEDGGASGKRPKDAGAWEYADAFYRVPLRNYTAFDDPFLLKDIFASQRTELEAYVINNRKLPPSERELLFFTIQGGRLQCQNGAYGSYISERLAAILLGPDFDGAKGEKRPTAISARTGEQIRQIRVRVGQDQFSANVRSNYGSKCCFPGCSVADEDFLVGAHIARWADSPEERGKTENGLCFCLFHDRAFEKGYFSLSDDRTVLVNPSTISQSKWAKENLSPYVGKLIAVGSIQPSAAAIREHRKRVGIKF